MSDITTEVCKREINIRSTLPGRKNPNDWKRISKRGTASETIVRVFQHRTLAQWATVSEVDGAITSVTFSQTAPSAPTIKAGKAGTTTKDVATPEPSDKAAEYLFAFVRREDGQTNFAVCPVSYWAEENCLSDFSLDGVDKLLPPGSHETSESQYATKLSWNKLRAYMLARGFKEDEDFSGFMNDEF